MMETIQFAALTVVFFIALLAIWNDEYDKASAYFLGVIAVSLQ